MATPIPAFASQIISESETVQVGSGTVETLASTNWYFFVSNKAEAENGQSLLQALQDMLNTSLSGVTWTVSLSSSYKVQLFHDSVSSVTVTFDAEFAEALGFTSTSVVAAVSTGATATYPSYWWWSPDMPLSGTGPSAFDFSVGAATPRSEGTSQRSSDMTPAYVSNGTQWDASFRFNSVANLYKIRAQAGHINEDLETWWAEGPAKGRRFLVWRNRSNTIGSSAPSSGLVAPYNYVEYQPSAELRSTFPAQPSVPPGLYYWDVEMSCHLTTNGTAILTEGTPVEIPAEPPDEANLIYWLRGSNLDGSDNATLINNQSLTSIVNLGTRGGTFTPPGTAPKYKVSGGIGTVLFAGSDNIASAVGAAVPAPSTMAIVVNRTKAGTGTCVFGDGADATHRIGVLCHDGNNNDVIASATLQAFDCLTTSKFNVVILSNNGSSSFIDANFPFDGVHNAAATIGTDSGFTKITIGAAYDNSNTLQGEIREVLVWSSVVSAQSIHNYISGDLNAGWPVTTLTHNVYPNPAATPNLSIVGGDKVVFFGDSITQNSQWQASYITSVNGAAVTPITSVNAGIGGNTVVALRARVNADVISLSPQPAVVIIQCGINDFGLAVPIGELATSVQGLIDDLTSGISGVRLMWCGPLCRGEYYPDPVNIQFKQYNNAIASVCADNGVTFVDWRAMQQAYEAVNNTPPPGAPSGLLTSDAIHPNATGKSLMASAAFAQTTVTG